MPANMQSCTYAIRMRKMKSCGTCVLTVSIASGIGAYCLNRKKMLFFLYWCSYFATYNDFSRSCLQQVFVNPFIGPNGFKSYGIVDFFSVVHSFDDREYCRESDIKAFQICIFQNFLFQRQLDLSVSLMTIRNSNDFYSRKSWFHVSFH